MVRVLLLRAPLSKILDELSFLKLWKEKQERKEKRKKRVEEISLDERKKIREEEKRKIMKEMCRNMPFCGRAKARLTGALSKGGKMPHIVIITLARA